MRVGMGLVARADNGSTPRDRTAAIDQAISRACKAIEFAFPIRNEELEFTCWRSTQGDVALLTWHNEGGFDSGPIHSKHANGSVAWLGYGGESLTREAILASGTLLADSTRLAGCFALFRATPDGIEALTDATRSNGLYYAESKRLRMVASRALLVHLMQQSDMEGVENPIPKLNLVGLRHMALAGHFIADQTPFVGVHALANAESVRFDPWFTRRHELPATPHHSQDLSPSDYASIVDEVASSLVAAFDVIPGKELNVALTGGRDSRLLAAALLHRPDVHVTTSTTGMADDPDVVIARMISEVIGAKHRLKPPGGVVDEHRVQAEEPLSRIVRALDVHDAMTSGWDDIEDYGPMVPTPVLSGVGGEILRGGLVFTELDNLDMDTARVRLTNLMTGGDFFTEPYMESARVLARPLLNLVVDDPYRAIDDFYYIHRNARWVSARRAGARFRRRAYDPMLDNRFVRLVRSVPPEVRWKERLAFDVLRALSPDMSDLPLEGHRWRFERTEPEPSATEQEKAGWHKRIAIVRSKRSTRVLWHLLEHEAVRSRVRALILDNLRGRASELLDRHAVERYLEPRIYQYPTTVWHIATCVVILSIPWYKTLRLPRTYPITIDWTSEPASDASRFWSGRGMFFLAELWR
jgi:asparagine synthetase B (glutamine-hydrolysing)